MRLACGKRPASGLIRRRIGTNRPEKLRQICLGVDHRIVRRSTHAVAGVVQRFPNRSFNVRAHREGGKSIKVSVACTTCAKIAKWVAATNPGFAANILRKRSRTGPADSAQNQARMDLVIKDEIEARMIEARDNAGRIRLRRGRESVPTPLYSS